MSAASCTATGHFCFLSGGLLSQKPLVPPQTSMDGLVVWGQVCKTYRFNSPVGRTAFDPRYTAPEFLALTEHQGIAFGQERN